MYTPTQALSYSTQMDLLSPNCKCVELTSQATLCWFMEIILQARKHLTL